MRKYLFYYRSTIQCSPGYSPVLLQSGRNFRTKLDIVRPTGLDNMIISQNRQIENFTGNRKINFDDKQIVMAIDYSNRNDNKAWKQSQIIEKFSPVTYSVLTKDNKIWKRHADQLKPCKS